MKSFELKYFLKIGFNAGSSYGVEDGKFQLSARAGAGTTIATMGAGATSLLISLVKNKGKIDVSEVLFGIMSSLGNNHEIVNHFN